MRTTKKNPDLAKMHARLLKEEERIQRLLQELEEMMGTSAGKAQKEAAPPATGPLGEVQELLKATEDLRTASGNLSATAVAAAFGVSVNKLTTWLGRTRQALNKTPDADSLQEELACFERVARLRAALPKDAFLKWLRMPNAQLDGAKPLDLLGPGDRQVVAGLAEDMLTGAPT